MSLSLNRMILVAAAMISCGGEVAPEAAAPESPPTPAALKTVAVASGADFVIARYPATAIARADGTATVASPCEGQLVRLVVNEGDVVASGTAIGTVACIDAGVLDSRRTALDKRISALERRRRELDTLRTEGLVEVQRIVDIDRELLALRGELSETRALIERSGLAGAGGNDHPGQLPLHAPRDGIITHIAAQSGTLLDRIGTPILTLASAQTDRIEAALPVVPSATTSFDFVALSGGSTAVTVVSTRGPDGDSDEPRGGSALRAVFAVANNDGTMPLLAGARGHVEMREVSQTAGLVPVHALQRRPGPRGSADTFCIFPADTANVCHPVAILGARGDLVLITDAAGVTPRVAVGLLVVAEVPSHIQAERDEDAP